MFLPKRQPRKSIRDQKLSPPSGVVGREVSEEMLTRDGAGWIGRKRLGQNMLFEKKLVSLPFRGSIEGNDAKAYGLQENRC